MEESLNSTLTVLYTADLRGNLDLLPRLYSLLKRLRAEFSAERVVLLDLGNACDSDVWHCAVTGGRSMLIALDGMGYDAASVTGILTSESRAKIADMGEIVRLELHDFEQPYRCDTLRVTMQAAVRTSLEADLLSLAAVKTGEVGVAHLTQRGSDWHLETFGVYALTPGTLPDPTIAGMVEFITAEARYAQKKRASAPRDD